MPTFWVWLVYERVESESGGWCCCSWGLVAACRRSVCGWYMREWRVRVMGGVVVAGVW